MVFDLAVNVNAFPKCSKCKGEMALVKVVETETESFDKAAKRSITMAASSDTDEKKSYDAAVFFWKCSCGNMISESLE